jgi:hypothetical protein
VLWPLIPLGRCIRREEVGQGVLQTLIITGLPPSLTCTHAVRWFGYRVEPTTRVVTSSPAVPVKAHKSEKPQQELVPVSAAGDDDSQSEGQDPVNVHWVMCVVDKGPRGRAGALSQAPVHATCCPDERDDAVVDLCSLADEEPPPTPRRRRSHEPLSPMAEGWRTPRRGQDRKPGPD